MAARRMHADEAETDVCLVRRLLGAQFPQWAELPVTQVGPVGTSNAMYRLGEDMVVRLPRVAGSAADVDKEHTWLPRLAPPLPVAIPVPLGRGRPGEGYPWPWSVYRWLDGEPPGRAGASGEAGEVGDVGDAGGLAEDLAGFVGALHRIDPADGPPAYRSEALATRDTSTRAAIEELAGREYGFGYGHSASPAASVAVATAVWDAALRAPGWDGPAVWIHAGLQPGNLLTVRGRLSAVIDFGCLGVGDPAVDLIVAWYVLPAAARGAFRAALGPWADDAAWVRGRGWALSIGLMELRYYREPNPVMAATARYVIGELLRDHEAGRAGRPGRRLTASGPAASQRQDQRRPQAAQEQREGHRDPSAVPPGEEGVEREAPGAHGGDGQGGDGEKHGVRERRGSGRPQAQLGGDGHGVHQDPDHGRRGERGEQPGGQAQAAEEFRDPGQGGEEDAGFVPHRGEALSGGLQARPAEAAEQLLGAMARHDQAHGQPEEEHPDVVGAHRPRRGPRGEGVSAAMGPLCGGSHRGITSGQGRRRVSPLPILPSAREDGQRSAGVRVAALVRLLMYGRT